VADSGLHVAAQAPMPADLPPGANIPQQVDQVPDDPAADAASRDDGA